MSSSSFASIRNSADAMVWMAPIAVLLATYHGVVHAWWMADDSMLLLSTVRHGVVAHFVRPLADLELIPSNLTPWLYASYGIDFAIGGLDPRIAYVHHLISWSATLGVLVIALRRWLGPLFTAAALICFVLAVPTAGVVQLLCTRHYMEGLLVATLAVLAYTRFRRTGHATDLAISAGCYAWAMMAKEVYVPLGPLLVLHHVLYAHGSSACAGLRSRSLGWLTRIGCSCTTLWPYILLSVAYVLYRGYMLGFGRLLAGYDEIQWQSHPAMILDFPATWQWACHWKRWQTIGWAVLVTAGIASWLSRTSAADRRRGIAFGSAVTIAILAPLYPVLALLTAYHVNIHYLFVPLLAFFALAGWAGHQCTALLMARIARRSSANTTVTQRVASIVLAGVLLPLAIGQLFSARQGAWPWQGADSVVQYRLEGEYELYSDDRALIVGAIGPTWHHFGLQQLRELVLHRSHGPIACAPQKCRVPMAQQLELGGSCVHYVSGPPRLEAVPCAGDS